jgi:hypothetical protein
VGVAAGAPAAGAVAAGRRRIDRRVTARTKATARAARPASWASTTVAPCGRAEVSATGRVRAFGAGWVWPVAGVGSSVGNRLAALPPELKVGLTAGMPGRVPTGSGEVTGGSGSGGSPTGSGGTPTGFGGAPTEDGGAVIETAADALSAFARCAVLPMTVRLTDLTADAVTGTVSWAWNCRWADFASTAPRSHEDVPSSLPQPKLNPGAPPLAGVACSRRMASVTFPPVVQALTVHWAACPRSLLGCAAATSTQRLTCAASGTAWAPLCELAAALVFGVGVVFAVGLVFGVGVVFAVGVLFAVRVRVGVGVGVTDGVLFGALFKTRFEAVGVADGVPLAEALRVLVGVADGDRLAFAVVLAGAGVADSVLVGAFVGVTAGLDFSVRVGTGVAFDEGAAEWVAVPLAVAVGDGLVVAGFDVGAVGVVVGVVLAGVGVGVAVGVGFAGVVAGAVGDGVGVVGVAVGEVGVGDGEV